MILVTGGAGYIGSHTVVLLLEAGFDVLVYDNFCNASSQSIRRVEEIAGKRVILEEGDIRDRQALQKVFDTYTIESVIHFAGLKAVGESVEKPLKYYDNNVVGSNVLFEVMRDNGCKSIVFSSSATVYGDPETTPVKEDFPIFATNPYGRSKLFIEEMLRDVFVSDDSWRIVLLRYFNPVGAHESGTIGEDPNDIPNNLMPFISQTAVGKREYLSVFGDDYDTPDGTGVRDYIHVMDLADAHVKSLQKIDTFKEVMTINIGTGRGYSVLEVVKAFEKASGQRVPYKVTPRRAGDIAINYADTSYAKEVLGWEATRDIDQMCMDSWQWQSNNPHGYSE